MDGSIVSSQTLREASTRANFEYITSVRATARLRRHAAGEGSDDESSAADSLEQVDDRRMSITASDARTDSAGGWSTDAPELVRALELLASFPPIDGEEEPEALTETRRALKLRAAGQQSAAAGTARASELETLGHEAWSFQAERAAESVLMTVVYDGSTAPEASQPFSDGSGSCEILELPNV